MQHISWNHNAPQSLLKHDFLFIKKDTNHIQNIYTRLRQQNVNNNKGGKGPMKMMTRKQQKYIHKKVHVVKSNHINRKQKQRKEGR